MKRLEPTQQVISAQVWVCHDCGAQDHKSCGCAGATAYSEALLEKRAKQRQADARYAEKRKVKQNQDVVDNRRVVENTEKSATAPAHASLYDMLLPSGMRLGDARAKDLDEAARHYEKQLLEPPKWATPYEPKVLDAKSWLRASAEERASFVAEVGLEDFWQAADIRLRREWAAKRRQSGGFG